MPAAKFQKGPCSLLRGSRTGHSNGPRSASAATSGPSSDRNRRSVSREAKGGTKEQRALDPFLPQKGSRVPIWRSSWLHPRSLKFECRDGHCCPPGSTIHFTSRRLATFPAFFALGFAGGAKASEFSWKGSEILPLFFSTWSPSAPRAQRIKVADDTRYRSESRSSNCISSSSKRTVIPFFSEAIWLSVGPVSRHLKVFLKGVQSGEKRCA